MFIFRWRWIVFFLLLPVVLSFDESFSSQPLVFSLEPHETLSVFDQDILISQYEPAEHSQEIALTGILNDSKQYRFVRSKGYLIEFTVDSLVSTDISQRKKQKEHIFSERNRVIAYLHEHGGTLQRTYTNVFSGAFVIADEIAINDLISKHLIRAAWPNYRVESDLFSSVPLIGANTVWERTADGRFCQPEFAHPELFNESSSHSSPVPTNENCLTGRNVTISIIDSGIDYLHPDLGGCFGLGCKVAGGYDFVDGDEDPMDCNGHGTHVASIAAGRGFLDNGTPIFGVAPDASLFAYRVLGCSGSGFSDAVLAGIEMSVDPNNDGDFSDHVDVVSLSLGYAGSVGDPLSEGVNGAVDAGVVAVVAAGNSGSNDFTIMSPGIAEKAITVGASSGGQGIAPFSSRGPVLFRDIHTHTFSLSLKPDVVAPGVDICAARHENRFSSACGDGVHVLLSGTSMATPHVAGTVALMKQHDPSLSPLAIKTLLQITAQPFLDEPLYAQGHGLINARRATFFTDPFAMTFFPLERENRTRVLYGTIKGNYSEYEFSYAPYTNSFYTLPEKNWTKIVRASGDPRFLFDSSSIPDGKYILRLRAFRGNISYDAYQPLEVDKFIFHDFYSNDIINPSNPFLFSIENVYNISIANLSFEYSLNGGRYTSRGIRILAPEGHFLEAVLANNTLSAPGTLSFRVRITHDGMVEEHVVRDIIVDPSLQRGWPLHILYEKDVSSLISNFDVYHWPGILEPVVSDIDSDSRKDIILYQAGNPPILHVFETNGSEKSGWPLMLSQEHLVDGTRIGSPSIVDFDGDGLQEIVVNGISSLYVYSFNGTLRRTISLNGASRPATSTVIADLDSDGSFELIRRITPSLNGRSDEYLTLLNEFGETLSGWPRMTFNKGPSFLSCNAVNGIESTPAVGNFDADPELEIVVGSFRAVASGASARCEGRVFIFNQDGSIVEGFPLNISGMIFSSPSVADINHDGFDEIAVGTIPWGEGAGFFLIDHTGSVALEHSLTYGAWSSPAFGNFDEDEDLEIVISTLGYPYETFVFNADGSLISGWPQHSISHDYRSSVIGNSLQSNFSEIFITAGTGVTLPSSIFTWNASGSLGISFPKHMERDAQAAPTLANLDSHNFTSLVASSNRDYDLVSFSYKQRGSVSIWDLKEYFDESLSSWPMFHHDVARTGCLDCES